MAKEKEVWAAREKVQREKWEAEKVQAIRASAYQQMEPTLQTLIDKNKEEVRKAVEECEKRIENIRGQAVMEKRELQKKIDEI